MSFWWFSRRRRDISGAMNARPNHRRSIVAIWLWPPRVWCVVTPLLLFFAYLLSFAPACWIAGWTKSRTAMSFISLAYRPVAASIILGPRPYSSCMRWSIQLGLPAGVTLEEVPEAIIVTFPSQGYTHTILSL